MPVAVIVTFAVAVAVPFGAYCTLIVQLPPAATGVPTAQVPPAMIEKVPPAAPTLVTVGLAVIVSGPVPALPTVTKPLWVAVVPVTNDGAGPANVTLATVPVSASVCVPNESVIVSVAAFAPAVPVPWNCTTTVQLVPGVSAVCVRPQVVPATLTKLAAEPAVNVACPIPVIFTFPELVSVKICVGPPVPSDTFGKVYGFGVHAAV